VSTIKRTLGRQEGLSEAERETLDDEWFDAFERGIRRLAAVAGSDDGRQTLAALRAQAGLLRAIVGRPRLREAEPLDAGDLAPNAEPQTFAPVLRLVPAEVTR
jgi:hypothetical protein